MVNDDRDNTPAVWDPTARGGAGAWVRQGVQDTAEDTAADGAEDATARLPQVTEVDPPLARPYAPMVASIPAPTQPPMPPPPMVPPVPYGAPAQPPPPGYGYPQPPPETPPVPGRSRRPVIVAAVLVGAAVVGAGAVWASSSLGHHTHTGASAASSTSAAPSTAASSAPGSAASGSPSGTASASASTSTSSGGTAQAKALNSLLDQSMSSHQQVVDAVAAVQQCTSAASVTSAASQLDSAAQSRQQLISQLDALDLSQVSGASDATPKLRAGWQLSASADTAYANWARAQANSCTQNSTAQDADYQTATSDSTTATSDKQAFVLSWNQIAAQYGLPSRTWDGI